MSETDVLIVGAGPSGLMMACQLALCGVSFRIIDKNEDHTTQSRALVVQARSVEIFDQLGIAEKAIDQGLPAHAVGAYFNGKKVFRLVVNNIGEGLTKFPFLLMLEQSRTEGILIDFLKEHGYEVERKSSLYSISYDSHEVLCKIKLPDGKEDTIIAKFVIGADGAHSAVRESTGISFQGKTYQQTLFVLDTKAEVDIPLNEMYMAFSGSAVCGFFPLKNGRWRILGNIPKELGEREKITFDEIERSLAARTKIRVRLFDPSWIAVYKSHHRYASTFYSKRCFLIGDAAHIHSPVGAQGMNTGLQDAYNLAWKLSLFLKGKAKESLLNTYTEERISIAKNLVRSTDRVFHLFTSESTLIKIYKQYIIPLAFKLAVPLLERMKTLQNIAFKAISEIGINYRKSSLSQNASSGQFPSNAPKPGDRLPFVKFRKEGGEESSTHELIKNKFFCLLIFSNQIPSELDSVLESFKDFFSVVLIPLNVHTQILYKKFGVEEGGFYLIRPDMYISYRKNGGNIAHFEKYLDTFLNK